MSPFNSLKKHWKGMLLVSLIAAILLGWISGLVPFEYTISKFSMKNFLTIFVATFIGAYAEDKIDFIRSKP